MPTAYYIEFPTFSSVSIDRSGLIFIGLSYSEGLRLTTSDVGMVAKHLTNLVTPQPAAHVSQRVLHIINTYLKTMRVVHITIMFICVTTVRELSDRKRRQRYCKELQNDDFRYVVRYPSGERQSCN